jgi:hypothetical protein
MLILTEDARGRSRRFNVGQVFFSILVRGADNAEEEEEETEQQEMQRWWIACSQ